MSDPNANLDVLIVDDEPLARERLAQMLKSVPGTRVVGSAGNGREAIQRIEESRPRIVLLDIRMPVMDGLEAAHHLRLLDHHPVIIFCTAFDQHALEAFEANAIDYLVKPVRLERLRQAIAKARQYDAGAAPGSPPKPATRTHLCARIRGNLELVPVSEVLFLHAEHKYVTVVHRSGEVLIEEPLKSLETEFADVFVRIHRNALVALKAIAGLEKSRDGHTRVRLNGTDRKPEISRRNLPQVRKIVKAL